MLNRYSRPYTLPLSKSEVRRALRLGLGRLHLHFLQHGLEEHRELLFDACLKNLVYDAQCEAERAPWLVPLLTPECEGELSRLLLQTLPRTRSWHDASQQCCLSFHLARRGHAEAHQALYLGFRIARDGRVLAAEEIMDLDGAEGLRWVSRQVLQYRWLRDRPEILERFIWHYQSRAGAGSARDVFANCPELAPYWPGDQPETDPAKGRCAWQGANEEFASLSVGEVLARIQTSTSRYFIPGLKAWAQVAGRAQRKKMAEALRKESDPHRLGHLLTVFRHNPLSSARHIHRLLELADHQDPWVRRRAHQALGEVRHPAVRARAICQLQAQNWFLCELLPLKSNLLPEDSLLFDHHLRVARKPFQHHRLIGDLVDILHANPWPEMLRVMLFVYATSPCTHCRQEIYQLMDSQGIAPTWVTSEWPYDAYHGCQEA